MSAISMTHQRLVRGTCLLVLGMLVGSATLWGAEEGSRKSKSRTSRKSRASQKTKDPLEAKLDDILQVQQSILQQIDELTEELRIAKVRVSR